MDRGAYESVEEVVDAALAAVEQRTVPGFAGTQEELDALLAEGLASKELAEDEFWGSVNAQTNALLAEHKTGLQYITIEPGKRGGKPCVRGMRITVYEVLDYLASGMTEAEILADFPDLTAEDLKACLAFAADRERKLVTIPS